MRQLVSRDILVTRHLAGLFEGLLHGEGYDVLLLFTFGSGEEIGGYAVTPPELARDAPILYVLQPVAVGRDILGGIEFELSFEHGGQGDVGKVLHGEEPLLAEARLYGRVLVALGVPHLVVVVLHLLHQAGLLQVGGNLFAHLHAIHAYIEACCLRNGAVRIEDVDGLQVVGLTEGVVVHVVGGSHLQATGTELHIHIAVFDDGDDATYQGYHHLMATQPLVLGVLGVDAHGRIAHDGFGTCGGHHGIVATVSILMEHLALLARRLYGVDISVGHVVAQVEEVALLVAVDDLLGREHGLCLGVPVDHAQATVDESFLVEVNEHLQHALATLLVHGESRAVPVARGTQLAELLEDDASVLLCPIPGVLEELFAGQVTLLDALGSQLVDHLSFGGDAGMVGSRHPAGVLALHAGTTHQDVLDGIVEHVPHVEHTRDVGRRDDDGIGLTSIGFRTEQFVVHPILVPLGLHFSGVVLTC